MAILLTVSVCSPTMWRRNNRVVMRKNQLEIGHSQIVIYQTQDGEIKLDVRFDGDTVWLTQKLMAELFGTTKQNISLHLQNIIEDGELSENSVVKDFLTTATDGKNYSTKYYNLDGCGEYCRGIL